MERADLDEPTRAWSIQLVSLVTILQFASGCLISTRDTDVLEPEATRDAVHFESDEGMQSFQQSVLARHESGDAIQETSGSSFPLLWSTRTTTVLSENAFYNDEARDADLDDDHLISDAEVRAYAAR